MAAKFLAAFIDSKNLGQLYPLENRTVKRFCLQRPVVLTVFPLPPLLCLFVLGCQHAEPRVTGTETEKPDVQYLTSPATEDLGLPFSEPTDELSPQNSRSARLPNRQPGIG